MNVDSITTGFRGKATPLTLLLHTEKNYFAVSGQFSHARSHIVA